MRTDRRTAKGDDAVPELDTRERSLVECLNRRGVAIRRSYRTGIAREAAAVAAILARSTAHMRHAGRISKISIGEGIDRTGIHAGFPVTCLAGMIHFLNGGEIQVVVEKQRAAISMPQPIFGMNEKSQRRLSKPLGARGPLLERSKWPVVGHRDPPTDLSRNIGDDTARP